jgi:lambda family phage tail tape measure protein
MANRVQLTIGADDEATVVLRKVQAELARLGLASDRTTASNGRQARSTKAVVSALQSQERAASAISTRIALLERGTKNAATSAESLRRLVSVEQQLAKALQNTNISFEQRIRLGAAHAQATQAIANATAPAAQRTTMFAGALSGAGKAMTALGIAVSAAQVLQFAKQSIDAADAMKDLSEQTGVSVENLSVLQNVAQKSGLEVGAMTPIFATLAKTLEELAQGDEDTTQLFSDLGLSAAEFKGLALDEALVKIANAQSQFANGAEKSVAMQRLFGRSGREIVPLLNSLANGGIDRVREEMERLGLVMGSDTARKADELNERLLDLRTSAGIIVTEFAIPLLTAFVRIGEALLDVKRRLEDINAFALVKLLTAPHRKLLDLLGGTTETQNTGTATTQPNGGRRLRLTPSAKGAGRDPKDESDRALKEYQALVDRVADFEADLAQRRGQHLVAALDANNKFVADYVNAVRKLNKLTADEAAALANKLTAELGVMSRFDEAERQASLQLRALDTDRLAIQQDIDRGLISQSEGERRILDAERERLDVLKVLADKMAEFAEIIGDPELLEKARRLRQELAGMGKATDDVAKKTANLGDNIRDALQSDLAQFLGSTINEVNGLGQAFASLATSVISSIQRIVAELIAAQIISKIGGFLGLPSAGATPVKKAAGGYIRGPGTGTSDSIPAWLSNGEYVLRAAAVQKLGVGFLNMLNSGGLSAAAALPRVPRFATGGLVSAAALSAGGATDVVELRLVDEMLEARVLDTLSSGEGRRVQVRNLSRDARKSGRALDR